MRRLQIAAQITRRERIVAVRHQLRERTFEDDASAVFAGARPQVDDVIGGAHHVGIVLHHHDGVAEIAQLFQNADQAAGVAAVQTDGRFVEHVAGADQARAQAGGELDALRFAARERRRKPVQRQVFEPDVVQELQPLADLDQDLVGDGRFFRRQLQRARKTPAPAAMFSRTTSADGSSRRRERTAPPAAGASRCNPGTGRSRDNG